MSLAVPPFCPDTTFSIPFDHLWSTNFSGQVVAYAGTPSGLSRFVGDRPNAMLQYLVSDSTDCPLVEHDWPLVLFGPSGTGKTSLAMSRVASWIRPQAEPPVFLPAADFDRRYRMAMETDSVDEFRQRLLASSGLVIDDLHKLSHKPHTQHEIAVLIDLAVAEQLPLIITMDQSPATCDYLLPRLVSRLSQGLSISVQPPGEKARAEIVRDLAAHHQLSIDDDAVELIVQQSAPVTVPRLTQLFSQIKNRVTRAGDTVQPCIDRGCLLLLFQRDAADVLRMSQVISRTVAKTFSLSVADLKSHSRKQSIVLARGVAIYLNRRLLGKSFIKIGQQFGNRDHSTVMHSYRKICDLVDGSSPDPLGTHQLIQQLEQSLGEQFAQHLQFG